MESNDVFSTMDVSPLYRQVREEYQISDSYFRNQNVKRGLRNFDGTAVIAGITKIGSVQGYVIQDGVRNPIPGKLYYRGISVEDIVEAHRKENTFGFEEVSYLLLMGRLPNASELSLFESILAKVRPLPKGFFEDMILRNTSPDIMNMLGRSVLALYAYDENPDETTPENMLRQSIELIARFPSIVANAYMARRHMFDGKSMYIHNPKEALTLSENFLRLVRKDKSYTDEEAKLLDLLLILHAEHGGGNNSAFICRALSSSGTDTYSAIAGAVGSLKGPLHGGANRKVTEMFQDIKAHVKNPEDDDEVRGYLTKILKKEAGDGGSKFIGLEKNRNVGLAIFEYYGNPKDSHGLQVMGKAEFYSNTSDEFKKLLAFKGIPYDVLKAAAVEVAVVRVVPYRYEMYDTDFVKQGYDVRQIVDKEI